MERYPVSCPRGTLKPQQEHHQFVAAVFAASRGFLASPTNDFHHLLNAAPDAMILVDGAGLVSAINIEAEELFGCSESDAIGDPVTRFIPTRFHWLLGAILHVDDQSPTAATKGGTVTCVARRRDGSEFPVEMARRPVGKSRQAQSLVTMRDLTHWRRAQKHRSRSNAQAAATLESIGDAVVTTDAKGMVTYLNPVAERLTGWEAKAALGRPLSVVMVLVSELTRLPVMSTVSRCLEEGRSVDMEDGVLLLRRDGTEIPIGDSAAPIRDAIGKVTGVVVVIQDESERRRIGQRLSFEASHDVLTGLINRREFERRLGRAFAEQIATGAGHVLLCLDLDGFKAVNDSGGHDAGDALLRTLGPLLTKLLRKGDTLARIGGDEFGVLLENCPMAEAARIAESLRSAIAQHHFAWIGRTFTVGVSIGLTPVVSSDEGIVAVLRAADTACYAAKGSGGNRVHVAPIGADATDIPALAEQRLARLTRALEEHSFQLYAQPIVTLQPGLPERTRLEVLLRLPDGEGRIQAAADFLPLAERHNLMFAIDQWVIRETIALLSAWQREHPHATLPVCSINLSAAALASEGLVAAVRDQLAVHEVPADTLCFEVTESVAIANLAQTAQFLSGMRATGCGMALEDCGDGLTSLTYLKQLPVDFLKIGGRFVEEIVDDPICGSIVSAVHQIGQSMGIATIAKQVGSEPIIRKLRSLGIGYGQGRAFTPPVPLLTSTGRVNLPFAANGRCG